jgi:hypothetical protein
MIDLNAVPHHQRDMHSRLLNWAMWAKPGTSGKIHPMWAQSKSNAWQWHPREFRPTCDTLDAHVMEKEICKLPKDFRDALIWFYIFSNVSVTKARKALAATIEGLNSRVIDGRQMLLNRLG